MLDFFLFVALPYLAIATMVAGSIWRYRSNRFSYSALSSQFLDGRRLLLGSVPWHVGILVLFLGHLVVLLFPGLWTSLTVHRPFLLAVEAIGLAAALLAVFGLVTLFLRRLLSARLQRVTTTVDLLVVGLLLGQVLLGIGVATMHRYGSRWSAGTLVPYVWGILTFRPDASWVAAMPPVVKLHVVGAWLVFLLLPFSRLVHVFSLPFRYVLRPPQKVVWATARRLETRTRSAVAAMEGRRHFVKGALGVTAAAALLSAGVLDKLLFFFRGPTLTPEQEAEVLKSRLDRLDSTVTQQKLALERMRRPYIFVARLASLDPRTGKYFTDYRMRPAMAFLDPKTGLPELISAKCTHLGCTVANEVSSRGLLLCPCHHSYFHLRTGVPTPSSPAKAPLPLLGYVLMDPTGKIIARKPPGRPIQGQPTHLSLKTASVYIAREFGSEGA